MVNTRLEGTTNIPLAFYAPMKSPLHPNPSGDRQLARLLIKALGLAGFKVELASQFRSRDGQGNVDYQNRIQSVGKKLAYRLCRQYQQRPESQRPKIWFTYHLYHKAPDWLGPIVSQHLGIPYVVVEASYAPKQLQGPWHHGVQASLSALRQADLAFYINPIDVECLQQVLPTLKQQRLAPFLDLPSLLPTSYPNKQTLAKHWQLNDQQPWLITVAMMRSGDKTQSYELLAQSLAKLNSPSWQLLVIGDGENNHTIKNYFASFNQVHFLGKLDHQALLPLLNASDVFIWPAVNEAFGFALLEAQAAGTAILVGNEGGVASIMQDNITGQLAPPRDAQALAQQLQTLLENPQQCHTMGQAAARYIRQNHSLDTAADTLKQTLLPLLSH